MVIMLTKMYKEGRLTETQLTNAINRGWITEAEKQEIIANTA